MNHQTAQLLDAYRDAVLKANWTAKLAEQSVLGERELRIANDKAEAARQALEEHIERLEQTLSQIDEIVDKALAV